jgi:hypothetical protein
MSQLSFPIWAVYRHLSTRRLSHRCGASRCRSCFTCCSGSTPSKNVVASLPALGIEVIADFEDRLEFFNRLDAVVTFRPLERATIEAITRKELEEIEHREGLRRIGARLVWTDASARTLELARRDDQSQPRRTNWRDSRFLWIVADCRDKGKGAK